MNILFLVSLAVTIIIILFLTILFFDDTLFSENKKIMKSDEEILREINLQATIYKNNNDEKNYHKQVVLFEEKIKQNAINFLDMNIIDVSVDLTDPETGIGSFNFPFRDSSDIEISSEKEPLPVCNIPEKIPTHLKKFLDEPIFEMFSQKYSKYDTELTIIDERGLDSQVHYGLYVISEDNSFSASTTFHVNTCTDEIQEDFPRLFCRNVADNEIHQSSNQDDIIASLNSDKFCTIHLDSWRHSIHEYGESIQKQRLELFDTSFEPKNHDEMRQMGDERERLDSLRGITFLIVNTGLDSKTTQDKIQEYNEKFDSLPDELLELIEKSK